MNLKVLSQNILLTTFASLLLFSYSGRTIAQTPTPTPESEEISRLREEKTRAELEKDIAVAEKAEADAKYPKPTTSPLAGETKINEGAVIESEMVSYLSMAYAANRMMDRLNGIKIDRLAVYNKADIDLLLNYKATTAQLDILKQQFCNLIPEGKRPPECPGGVKKSVNRSLSLISSFLGSFVDMTALLRTNVTIQGHTFSIDEASLVSEVFRALRATGKEANLYYPAVFPPVDPDHIESELLGKLEVLHDLKALVFVEIDELDERLKKIAKTKEKIAKLEAFIKNGPQELANAKSELARLEKLQKDFARSRRQMPFEALERMARLRETIEQLEADIVAAPGELTAANDQLAQLVGVQGEDTFKESLSKMRTVNERFERLVDTLIKTDSATGINSLTAYIRAENLKAVMEGGNGGQNSYWLQLAVVKAGGNNRIKTNLVIDIFTGGNRVSHSGGVIVQYNLYDLNGRSVVSDTLTEYTGYIKAGRIRKLKNPDNEKPDQPRLLP